MPPHKFNQQLLDEVNNWMDRKIYDIEQLSEENSNQLLRIVSDYADHINRKDKMLSDIKDSLSYLTVEVEKALLHEVKYLTKRKDKNYVKFRF